MAKDGVGYYVVDYLGGHVYQQDSSIQHEYTIARWWRRQLTSEFRWQRLQLGRDARRQWLAARQVFGDARRQPAFTALPAVAVTMPAIMFFFLVALSVVTLRLIVAAVCIGGRGIQGLQFAGMILEILLHDRDLGGGERGLCDRLRGARCRILRRRRVGISARGIPTVIRAGDAGGKSKRGGTQQGDHDCRFAHTVSPMYWNKASYLITRCEKLLGSIRVYSLLLPASSCSTAVDTLLSGVDAATAMNTVSSPAKVPATPSMRR